MAFLHQILPIAKNQQVNRDQLRFNQLTLKLARMPVKGYVRTVLSEVEHKYRVTFS